MIEEKKGILKGHLAALGAYTIFGFNILFSKDLATSSGLSPMGLFSCRALGAAALFWLVSIFMPKEKVDRKDFPAITLASLIGFIMVQIFFLIAIKQSTAVDAAIVGTLSPVFTMFFAAIFIKEPITLKKGCGVLISLVGILAIILTSSQGSNGVEVTTTLGWIMLFLNAACFAAYLGMFKPLIAKYNVVTFMKWVFLISSLLTLPFSIKELVSFDFLGLSSTMAFELAYLVVLATFFTYFLIPYSQKRIRPTLVSMYSYMQPIITAILGIAYGTDLLSLPKIIAILAVCLGVWMVNNSKSANS